MLKKELASLQPSFIDFGIRIRIHVYITISSTLSVSDIICITIQKCKAMHGVVHTETLDKYLQFKQYLQLAEQLEVFEEASTAFLLLGMCFLTQH